MKATYPSILDNLQDAYIQSDNDGIIIMANPSAARMYRYDSAEDMFNISAATLYKTPENREQLMEKLKKYGKVNDYESEAVRKDNTFFWISLNSQYYYDKQGQIQGTETVVRDISERKKANFERETTIKFLSLVNESTSVMELINSSLSFFKQQSGCEAVGIRLQEENDYPYYETQGFPGEFILLENNLCTNDEDGNPITDCEGYPIMECMCGNVICGRFDPSQTFFTNNGSFWTNNTTKLLATSSDEYKQSRTRDICNGEGYESVALLPLISGSDRLGLLQLNDKSKNIFSPELIAVWERLAGYLSVALAKFLAEENKQEMLEKEQLLTEELQLSNEELCLITKDLQDANEQLLNERNKLYKVNLALKENQEKFTKAFQNNPAAMTLNKIDGKFVDVNKSYCDLTGYSKKELIGNDPSKLGIIPKNILEEYMKISPDVPIYDEEIEILTKSQQKHTIINSTELIELGSEIRYISFNYDITDRKKSEKLLKESEAKFRKYVETSPDVIWEIDSDGNFTYVSPQSNSILGYKPEKLVGKSAFSLIIPESLEYVKNSFRLHSNGSNYMNTLEVHAKHSKGDELIIEIRSAKLLDNEGNIIGFRGTATNVTNRALATKQLIDSIHEKNVLLQEIHHRVKNNMQIVSSLLNLQIRHVKDVEAVNILKESQNRVKSMAMIHEKLYQSSNFNKIALSDYVNSLITELFYSYKTNTDQISTRVDVGDVKLNIETALPCGLIINELISNSLKYGFPDAKSGEIYLSLNSLEDGYELIVGDSGVGFPDDIDFRNTKSLGLQLINNLVQQIDGVIKLNQEHGTEFKIIFKEQKYKNRV